MRMRNLIIFTSTHPRKYLSLTRKCLTIGKPCESFCDGQPFIAQFRLFVPSLMYYSLKNSFLPTILRTFHEQVSLKFIQYIAVPKKLAHAKKGIDR